MQSDRSENNLSTTWYVKIQYRSFQIRDKDNKNNYIVLLCFLGTNFKIFSALR